MSKCNNCGLLFTSFWGLCGHKQHCESRCINTENLNKLLSDPFYHEEVEFELDDVAIEREEERQEEEFKLDERSNEDIEQNIEEANSEYLQFQEALIYKIEEYELEISRGENMKKVKLSTGSYAYGNRNAYTELVKFAESRMQLSESDNTDLIRTIKRMSCAIGSEIPLPSRYTLYDMAI